MSSTSCSHLAYVEKFQWLNSVRQSQWAWFRDSEQRNSRWAVLRRTTLEFGLLLLGWVTDSAHHNKNVILPQLPSVSGPWAGPAMELTCPNSPVLLSLFFNISYFITWFLKHLLLPGFDPPVCSDLQSQLVCSKVLDSWPDFRIFYFNFESLK